MDKMIDVVGQDIASLKSLVKTREQLYQAAEDSAEKLEKKDIIMERVIQALLVEIERIEYLSGYLYEQGKVQRGFYRKNEAKQLRAIVGLMQKKT
jgi:hypothetical protein